MKKPFLTVALLLWALGVALAFDPNALYVSTSGNNSNDGTTAATAFLTVQKAVDSVSAPPQTIYIASGVYDEHVTISAPVNDPGLPGYKMVVTGGGTAHLTALAINVGGWTVDPNIVVGPTSTATPSATATFTPTATPT